MAAMSLITDTDQLAAFCRRQADAAYVTVDTEFLRDSTYWPKLCLIQVAGPAADDVVAVDPLAEGMDLRPLLDLLANPEVVKVFHAAKQDMEIFYNLMDGTLPTPVFDTQVAAMVCGFGEQVGYDTLAKRITGAKIDKAPRFADWSQRPLPEKQLSYALADVTHLREIYTELLRRLEKSGRARWLDEELAALTDPATYEMDPDAAWQRLKRRSGDSRYLAVLREVAAWREREAQRRDVPRNRIIKDEQIQDIAAQAPRSPEALARMRGLNADFARGKLGSGVLEAVERAVNLPADQVPKPAAKTELPPGKGPLLELLKVLLKAQCEAHGVAQRLVATTADLEKLVSDDRAGVAALRGWRYEIFGKWALALKRGELALSAGDGQVEVLHVDTGEPAAS
ncbi:ribonuclease D [Limimonas halophila]|uniref:Ribonuclease D n=1 Tax=Limimonas halophila TaxID=1082479 RepID=A0A1G7P7B8_9PROT|nr:ribonuclease D [Limimonas halophila]